MYVYLKSEPNLWTVGYYNPQGQWNSESDFSDKEQAVKRVRFLNGGNDEYNISLSSCKQKIEWLEKVNRKLLRACKFALQFEYDLKDEGQGEEHPGNIQKLEKAIAAAEGE